MQLIVVCYFSLFVIFNRKFFFVCIRRRNILVIFLPRIWTFVCAVSVATVGFFFFHLILIFVFILFFLHLLILICAKMYVRIQFHLPFSVSIHVFQTGKKKKQTFLIFVLFVDFICMQCFLVFFCCQMNCELACFTSAELMHVRDFFSSFFSWPNWTKEMKSEF